MSSRREYNHAHQTQVRKNIQQTRKNQYSQRVQPRTSDTSKKEHIVNNLRAITLSKLFCFQNIKLQLLGTHELSLFAKFQILSLTNGQQRVRKKITNCHNLVSCLVLYLYRENTQKGRNSFFKLIIQIILKVCVKQLLEKPLYKISDF